MKACLTIAGSDSGGGAGIQQDMKVFYSLGVWGASCITGITAQNTKKVTSVHVLPSEIIKEQIDAVMGDMNVDAVKIGMLGNEEAGSVVYKKMKEYGVAELIVDPIIFSTSGAQLYDGDIGVLRKLCGIAKLSTPNLGEAEMLAGMKIKNNADMRTAAKKIGSCLITTGGGEDLLHANSEFYGFCTKKRHKGGFHGTGCTLSAAITAYTANGMDMINAVKSAKEYVAGAIERGNPVGKGMFVLYPALGSPLAWDLASSVMAFVSNKNAYKLAPEVGINIAYAIPGAKSISDIFGVSGRIVRVGKSLVPAGRITKGGSSHMGRAVLAAMKFDPEKRCAMNIRFGDDIVGACKNIGLNISYFNRADEPAGASTMDWGVETAIIKSKNKIPSIICDRGGVGKEAMTRIIGSDPEEVVGIALKIAKSC